MIDTQLNTQGERSDPLMDMRFFSVSLHVQVRVQPRGANIQVR